MKIHGKTAAEIYDCVRTLALAGQLPAGASLPPVRDLAVDLGVNRNTVASAYRRLVTAGIAVTQGRLGTIIRDPFQAGEQEGTLANSPLTDFASGNPNPSWLPDPNAALRLRPYRPRLYGEPTINAGLEAHLRKWFQPDCPAHFDVDLTHGAVDALERLLGAYLVAGDKVAVENPCFLSSINTLRTIGLQAIGVPVDAQGMRADGLEAALAKGAQAVIITPRAHNPTGCNLSDKRARALARLLARHPDVMVIVDDHFALLSNAAYHPPIPDNAYRWALVRSFSKALGPDIRIAAVASDSATSRQLRLRLAAGTNWVSHLLQDIVEVQLTQPETVTLLTQARADYANRRNMLEDALRAQEIDVPAQSDGLNLRVPLQTDDQAISLALARQGWLVRHGDAFSVQEAVPGLRITISRIEPAQCARLAQDLRHSLG
jgi:DNA-binding transcriptional MocR family regulator